MYGMMIPILYPIALLGIINIYITDRILLAYYYKKPPVTDTKLLINVLNNI